MLNSFYKSSSSIEKSEEILEAEFELGKRIKSSSISNLPILLTLIVLTSLTTDYPVITYSLAALIFVTSIIRFILCLYQRLFYPRHQRLWVSLSDTLLILTAFIWGVICALCFDFYGLASINSAVLLLIVTGLSASATATLNIFRSRAILYNSLVLGVPFSYALLHFETMGVFAVSLFIYFLFLAQQVYSQSSLYWELMQSRRKVIDKNKQIKQALKSKDTFLANMSHEIRTPMNGVLGITELLLNSAIDAKTKEKLTLIKNSGDTLLDIIDDILDFAKLESGKLDFEKRPFPLHEKIEENIALMIYNASKKGLIISYDPGVDVPNWIIGDVSRVNQICINLIGNAIKFTEQGSIQVSSSLLETKDGIQKIQIAIEDTGIGIPEDGIKKLFHSFSQVDASTTRRFGGSGLGLSICKRLCNQMGGEIWVESEAKKGSTFYFTLLSEKIEQPQKIRPSTSIVPDEKEDLALKVIVAEDNVVNQIVTMGLLKSLGYSADLASNGKEVLDLLATKSYDLILMDCHMPDMDGFEATTEIIKLYSNETRPTIIALTASTMQKDIDRCVENGMDGFLSKPLTKNKLKEALSQKQHLFSKTA